MKTEIRFLKVVFESSRSGMDPLFRVLEKIGIETDPISEILQDRGTFAKVGDEQIAIFHFQRGDKWYACENRYLIRGNGLSKRTDRT
ncbi:hypothetical protein DLM78_00520 [Leptospira stimsonii]|uniref:Uncharacterized protein n=1 Tax=Leptospira stimsonii TaxID=2202203 RepID=A0A8B3CTD3_9LEPT|nr:hypothetical protein DLM78_00520 [Leptospira stimsonii]